MTNNRKSRKNSPWVGRAKLRLEALEERVVLDAAPGILMAGSAAPTYQIVTAPTPTPAIAGVVTVTGVSATPTAVSVATPAPTGSALPAVAPSPAAGAIVAVPVPSVPFPVVAPITPPPVTPAVPEVAGPEAVGGDATQTSELI